MRVIFEKVLERDIDLLMINKFINEPIVLEYFLEKVKLFDYKLISIEHSLMDSELGESDITLIVEKDKKKIGILIENKIDAIAMELQPERYTQRGEKAVENHIYDEFVIFIIAPKKYIDTNAYAKKYPNKITYEELLKLMNNDVYATSLLNKALEEKENGYMVIEHEMVTKFWKKYYEYIKAYYPHFKIHEIEGPRGARASWPEILTEYKNVVIMHKSDRGYMDLTFGKMASHIDIFHKYVSDEILSENEVIKTGKSIAIRLHVPPLDFKNEFDDYIDEMQECMKNANKLLELLNKIDVNRMYNDISKSEMFGI